MSDRRLYYRVILKILTALGLVVWLLVFLNSLFISNTQNSSGTDSLKLVNLNINGMQKGEIRKSYWNGKEVAILYRSLPFSFNTKFIAKLPHKSLNSGSRSRKAEYFVYMNYGDSGNCPLFYSADTFKDICSGKLFNSAGREINNQQQSYQIQIPPHYFTEDRVVFGSWNQ